MNNIIEKRFESKAQMNQAVLSDTVTLLENNLNEKNVANFFVSGGSTPEPLYRSLSSTTLPWERINVAMVDERWVEPNHPRSNEAFINRTLLINHAKSAPFLSMKRNTPTPEDALDQLNKAYSDIGKPNITILGMGDDGHTASLFPNAKGLNHAMETSDICCAIEAHKSKVTGEETKRVSISLQTILNSDIVYLLISGESKLEAYNKALAESDQMLMPVASILKQTSTPVHVYWAP